MTGFVPTGPSSPLTAEQYRHTRFVINLVEELADRGGFDPTELVNARTAEAFTPLLIQMRRAVVAFEALVVESGRAAGVDGTEAAPSGAAARDRGGTSRMAAAGTGRGARHESRGRNQRQLGA